MAMLSCIPPWEMTEIAGKSQIAGNSRARRKFVRWLDRALSSLTLPRRHLVSYALRSSSWMTLGVSSQTHFLCQNVVQIVSSDTSFSTDGISVALCKSHTNRRKDIRASTATPLNVLAPVPNLTYPRSVCLLIHFSPLYIVKLASFFWCTRCHLSRALVRFSRVCSL